MDLSGWALYAFITVVLAGAVLLHYRLREPAGRGRALLMALRTATLALLVLLLFDPALPAVARGAVGGDTIALVDGSLSMSLPEGDGTRWDAALARLAAEGVDRALRFGGDGVGVLESDRGPTATTTRLEPGIRAAAEAGAGRVIVITDGAVEDAGEALALARRTGVAVEVRRVGEGPAPNAGIAAVEAPAWMKVGEEARVDVTVAALGGMEDSLVVVLREGDRVVSRGRVEAPPPGRWTTTALRFTPRSAAAGPVRLDVALEGTDPVPDDDVRSVYVRITDEPAGVALVSFAPDQEPRFLFPVLERSLGVPVRGWMALPEGRFIRLGAGTDAGLSATEAEARRAVDEADLVVLHGLGAGSPGWSREAAARARRLLVFPASASLPGLPFAPDAVRAGDWYPAAEVPSSPVAPLMAGVEPGDAPPLESLRIPEAPPGWWSPLNVRLGRRGEARPVILAGTTGGRRVAVALGDGYWRWAFAGGASRELYDRLWSALGGWLMAETLPIAGETVMPAERVVARGQPVRFRVAGALDSVRVRLTATDAGTAAAPALEAVLPVRDGEAAGPALAPGRYRYEARGYGPRGVVPSSGGELTVERYSDEFTRPAVALDGVTGDEVGSARRVAAGRPLRASAWPWVLLVVLLCAEWVLRRRWGLR